ncbi:hypothetical protein [Klenkia taihuensis]|uniref:Uncharacterized protein n=1 Tax=Klenkia taihuensis TaxID=1225127 RepID=A0A1I1G6H7_9ACTN|nr:hypothetical protein [Klenkia taihuensis]GHE09935.1 hypothetical protein GCM10011381_17040 [Klenkia taihuensis]SFC07164.1 hypothetical protein SAMN05661030_0028 [Klenkia taihuensis]
MTEPDEKDQSAAEAQLHAGPRDEGGEGGMATRELRAREAEED